jgi:autotransporter-associated beta strand protein
MITNSLYVGSSSTGNGRYELSGSGLLGAYDQYIGKGGTGTFSHSGGTNMVSTTLYLGYDSTGSGTYELSDTATVSSSSEYIGCWGIGTFTQTGGTNAMTKGMTLGLSSGGSGTYNLNGGTLILSSLVQVWGSATFNFGGGTLQANGALSTAVPMNLTGIGGNANVDTNGNTVTLSGIISGTAGINKLGANTLTLSTANSYTGPTKILAGTLSLSKSGKLDGSNTIDVDSGAVFDVSAVSGGFILDSTQTLQGAGKIFGNLTVNGIHAPGVSSSGKSNLPEPLGLAETTKGIETIQGNYSLLGQLQIELMGTTAGTGYDQVLLSGSGTYNTCLSGLFLLDWTDMKGSSDSTKLWVLKNDTAGTLSGTFSNYANGAALGNYDGHDWCIWYGADSATGNLTGGNDVVIAAVPEPAGIILVGLAIISFLAYSWQRKRK